MSGFIAAVLLVSVSVPGLAQDALTFSGRIVDANTRQPLAGHATVFMNHEGSLVTDTTTANAEGFFRLSVPTKPNRVVVWADSYAPRNIYDPGMEESIALAPLETLTGHIVDWDNVPVANAIVHLEYGDASKDVPEWLVSGFEGRQFTTNSEGVFVVEGVLPNTPVIPYAIYEGALRKGEWKENLREGAEVKFVLIRQGGTLAK